MKKNIIEKYKSFIKAIDANPFDFMIDTKSIDFPLISQSFIENFKTLGITKAGCIIGEFTDKARQQKIVIWLDSEGEPNFPVADSENNFFSILPFGTGFMYDVGFKLLNNSQNKTEVVDDAFFTKEYEKIVGVKKHGQPEMVIKNAIKKYNKDLNSIIYK